MMFFFWQQHTDKSEEVFDFFQKWQKGNALQLLHSPEIVQAFMSIDVSIIKREFVTQNFAPGIEKMT